MRKFSFAVVGSLALVVQPLWGQTATDKATAEALFADGRKLMAAGNYAAACPKFAASQKLDPGVGTLLNLADCYEKKGLTASAWGEFREAASAARAIGSREREQAARDRAAALERRLSRLTITVAAGNGANVHVLRDGEAIDPAAFGTALPIDPGKHVVEASSPGKRPWSFNVDVKGEADQVTVSVPELMAERTAPGAAGTVDLHGGTGPSPAATDDRPGSSQRIIALGVGGVGLAGIAIGTVFGLKASSEWSSAKESCSGYPFGCTSDASNAQSAANVSTIAFVVGGVGLAAGAVLWFTAPSSHEAHGALGRTWAIRLGPSSVQLSGAFQ